MGKLLSYRYKIFSGMGVLPFSIIWLCQKQIEKYLDTEMPDLDTEMPDLPYGWLALTLGAVVVGAFLSDSYQPRVLGEAYLG